MTNWHKLLKFECHEAWQPALRGSFHRDFVTCFVLAELLRHADVLLISSFDLTLLHFVLVLDVVQVFTQSVLQLSPVRLHQAMSFSIPFRPPTEKFLVTHATVAVSVMTLERFLPNGLDELLGDLWAKARVWCRDHS